MVSYGCPVKLWVEEKRRAQVEEMRYMYHEHSGCSDRSCHLRVQFERVGCSGRSLKLNREPR